MPSNTIATIKERVLYELRTQAGLSTQIYAEDVILTNIQSTFDELMNMSDVFWPDYMKWNTWTVDGTTGEVTDDITAELTRHEDIRMMWYDQRDYPIQRLPSMQRYDKVRGVATFWEPLLQDPKIFRILPIDTPTASLLVHHKIRPASFVADDDVCWMDLDMIACGAAYYFLAGEGAEADATNSMRAHFITKRKEIIDNMIDYEVPLNRFRRAQLPDTWYTLS